MRTRKRVKRTKDWALGVVYKDSPYLLPACLLILLLSARLSSTAAALISRRCCADSSSYCDSNSNGGSGSDSSYCDSANMAEGSRLTRQPDTYSNGGETKQKQSMIAPTPRPLRRVKKGIFLYIYITQRQR